MATLYLVSQGCSAHAELECGCGGTTECLALCLCNGGSTNDCAAECGEAWLTPAPPSPSFDDREISGELLSSINDARAEGGCCERLCFENGAPLVANELLQDAALSHAADMVERSYISHDTPEGVDAITRIRRAGYRSCSAGENISVGEDDPSIVLAEFLGSYDHCLNVLEPRYSEIGIALVRDPDDEPYWVLTFGGHE